MDFKLTEEQLMIQQMTANFEVEELLPGVVDRDINKIWPKEQVSKMLQQIIKFENEPKSLDETDGLATAICHYFQRNTKGENKKYSNWKSFLKKNPDRLE